jgi:hypothetical protein
VRIPGPPRIGYHRLVATFALAALHGTLALVYLTPGLARGYPPPPNVNRVSIVTYIESLGPVWQITFGLTAVLLVVGMFRHKLLALAHTVAGAGMSMFASALWLGFAFSSPKPAILSALGFTACVVWHLTIGVTFARLAVMPVDQVDYPPPPRPRQRRRR